MAARKTTARSTNRSTANAAAKKSGRRSAPRKSPPRSDEAAAEPTWTFLSNHSHVILCLHREPDLTLREVAQRVGVTERSVQRIIGELEEAGFMERERVGLRNHYRFNEKMPLRHPIESHCCIGDLIEMVEGRRR